MGDKVMSSHADALELIQAAIAGQISPGDAADVVSGYASGLQQVEDFANLDIHRADRTGFPEVVWAPGKTPDQIATIMQALAQRQRTVLATRVEPEVYAAVRMHVPGEIASIQLAVKLLLF